MTVATRKSTFTLIILTFLFLAPLLLAIFLVNTKKGPKDTTHHGVLLVPPLDMHQLYSQQSGISGRRQHDESPEYSGSYVRMTNRVENNPENLNAKSI